jgi:hypothetical protein
LAIAADFILRIENPFLLLDGVEQQQTTTER